MEIAFKSPIFIVQTHLDWFANKQVFKGKVLSIVYV